MSLSRVQIDAPLAARIWRVVDDVKNAREQEADEERYVARAAALCNQIEREYLTIRAREEIKLYEAEQRAYCLQILRETNSDQIKTAA